MYFRNISITFSITENLEGVLSTEIDTKLFIYVWNNYRIIVKSSEAGVKDCIIKNTHYEILRSTHVFELIKERWTVFI